MWVVFEDFCECVWGVPNTFRDFIVFGLLLPNLGQVWPNVSSLRGFCSSRRECKILLSEKNWSVSNLKNKTLVMADSAPAAPWLVHEMRISPTNTTISHQKSQTNARKICGLIHTCMSPQHTKVRVIPRTLTHRCRKHSCLIEHMHVSSTNRNVWVTRPALTQRCWELL